MTQTIVKHTSKTTIAMIVFVLIGTTLLAYTYGITKEPIAKSEAEARMALFREILPESMHDNVLEEDARKLSPHSDLGTRTDGMAYIAKLQGQSTGVILEAIAPDGYSGEIKLLIAIHADGSLSGVRVLTHKETPGLGDYIDISRGNWIKLFDNESLQTTPDVQWQVKKDGGKFDYVTGATITPRAVVKAIHKALRYFQTHQAELLAEKK